PEKTMVWKQIRDRLDFAVMGRDNQHVPGTRPLGSSRNERLNVFTARYEESDFAEQIVEVSIEENGAATITGFPVLGCPAYPSRTIPGKPEEAIRRGTVQSLDRPIPFIAWPERLWNRKQKTHSQGPAFGATEGGPRSVLSRERLT